MILMFLLLLLVGVAWFMPIMWVAVGVFIVFWIVNKIADEKIANMTSQVQTYHKNPDDDFSAIRSMK